MLPFIELMCISHQVQELSCSKVLQTLSLVSSQVQDVTMEIQDLLQWLENTDLRLTSSKTMWGMPDSASERLSAHLVKSDAVFVLTALTGRSVCSTDLVNYVCLFTCDRSCAMRWTPSSTRTRMWKMPSTGCLRAATWSVARAPSTACLSLSRNGRPCTAKSRSGRSLIFFFNQCQFTFIQMIHILV